MSPNPTNRFLKIQFKDNSLKTLEIIDITNKTLVKKQFYSKTELIDLVNFKRGLYILKIQANNNVYTTKLIKK
ncbi:MAG TPA: T9SS type A sorting domain-containing protein [Lutibacter sp.]|nr:T9SS type A sorting domain-containing protein [Lutibacter sp.]